MTDSVVGTKIEDILTKTEDKPVEQVATTEKIEKPVVEQPVIEQPKTEKTEEQVTEPITTEEQDVSKLKNSIGDFNPKKLVGALIAEYGINGAAAEELVGECMASVETEMIASKSFDWGSFNERVIGKAVSYIKETQYAIEKQQKLERERDVRILTKAFKMFGEETAEEIIEAAEANYSKFTKIPKEQLRKVLAEDDYIDMLRNFRGTEAHFNLLNTDREIKESKDYAYNFLKSIGIEGKEQKQRKPTYRDILQEETEKVYNAYNGKTKH